MTVLSLTALRRFRVALVVAAIAWGGILASLVAADTVPPNPTIALQNAVHFLSPAGEDVVVAPGTYEVEAAKEGLQLTPQGGDVATAVVVQAQPLPHGESLTAPKVDVRPAVEDQYRVALLLPDGTGLEAVGSYSGVHTRGFEGNANTGYGTRALASNTIGNFNTAIGSEALYANTSGSWDNAVGFRALFKNSTGFRNIAMGTDALYENTTASDNTAVGSHALKFNTIGDRNTAMGSLALTTNTTGRHNTAMGSLALTTNTTGRFNTAMGASALGSNTTGIGNNAVGKDALVANTTGGDNVAVGNQTLKFNTTGNFNTAIGIESLGRNTTGNWNIAIGAGVGRYLTKGDNNIYLSHPGVVEESGTIRIGLPGVAGQPYVQTRTFLAGVSGVPVNGSVVQVDANGQLGITPSSRRYKEAIENMGTASQGLLHLRPVTFRYRPEVATGERLREYGLIAEEVAEVYPELVGHDAEGQIVTVQYHELIPMLLNEVQRQQREIEILRGQHRELEALPVLREQFQALTARVAELAAK